MIITLFLYLLYAVVVLITSPLRLFADVSMPVWISNAFTSVNGYLSSGYAWLPYTLNALLLTWGVYVAIELAIFSYKGIMWLIKKIPFIN